MQNDQYKNVSIDYVLFNKPLIQIISLQGTEKMFTIPHISVIVYSIEMNRKETP